MNRTAIFPGTFDPFTSGHQDLVERACRLFDHVIVTISVNSSKSPLFSIEERMEMIKEIFAANEQVSVEHFAGLLVDFAKAKSAVSLIRGLRAVSDFEYEMQMALMNRHLASDITTVFLMPNEKYTYLNSSIVKELAKHGGDFRKFVPANIYHRVIEKFKHL
ncbi:MAG: pantetheine-phosphate adenylyltransferase [Calditrichaeota bacterium]|nr:pantetheine-phosphate adenylyltransferase [Calditrichota bacterium]